MKLLSNSYRQLFQNVQVTNLPIASRSWRFYSAHYARKTKVCIVGGGPAGFYVTQHLIKHLPNADIDIVEKLPVPFGLVRSVCIWIVISMPNRKYNMGSIQCYGMILIVTDWIRLRYDDWSWHIKYITTFLLHVVYVLKVWCCSWSSGGKKCDKYIYKGGRKSTSTFLWKSITWHWFYVKRITGSIPRSCFGKMPNWLCLNNIAHSFFTTSLSSVMGPKRIVI